MYEPDYHPNAAVEQQQELLIQGRFSQPPTSVAHLADRVEASGAKIEETLQRLNFTTSTLFFVAGWVVLASSVISICTSLLSLSLIGLLQSFFLMAFGFTEIILDVPGAPRWASRYRQMASRQVKFLTRLTGKGAWNLFLASYSLMCLWPESGKSSGFVILIAVCMSGFVFMVGFVTLFIGIRKTLRLEKIRKQILNAYRGNTGEVYRKYAITDPTHGMHFEEFNRLSSDYSQGRLIWSQPDLALIYNALDDHTKGAINEREYSEWVAGPMTYI